MKKFIACDTFSLALLFIFFSWKKFPSAFLSFKICSIWRLVIIWNVLMIIVCWFEVDLSIRLFVKKRNVKSERSFIMECHFLRFASNIFRSINNFQLFRLESKEVKVKLEFRMKCEMCWSINSLKRKIFREMIHEAIKAQLSSSERFIKIILSFSFNEDI